MSSDNQIVEYACPNCDKKLKSQSGLSRHIKTIHPQPELTLVQKMGRPSLYDPKYCQEIVDYFTIENSKKVTIEKTTKYNKDGVKIFEGEKFKIIPNDMPTFSGFAMSIGVSHDALLAWATEVEDDKAEIPVKKHADFAVAYNIAKHLQKRFLIDNALQGNSPPASFIFVAKNVTDMTDKQIIETKDNDYKEKRDALGEFFDSIRHHIAPGPDNTGPDSATG